MSTPGGYGSRTMLQSLSDELNASLATADELSREFSSLLQEAAPVVTTTAQSFTPKPQISSTSSGSLYSTSRNGNDSIRGSLSLSQSSTSSLSTEPSQPSLDSISGSKETNLDVTPSITFRTSSPTPNLDASPTMKFRSSSSSMTLDTTPAMKFRPSSPSPLTQQHPSSMVRKEILESGYSYNQIPAPNLSPHSTRRALPMPLRPQDRSTRGSLGYGDQSPLSSPTYDNKTSRSLLQPSTSPLALYESSGPRSPRLDRASTSQIFNPPAASTLPRNFQPFRPSDEGLQKQKSPSKWNETDLDVSYERRTHHTYDKNEWIRPSVPNSNWKESNLDSPPSARKDILARQPPASHSSLPRNARISVPPDHTSPTSSLYGPQPIITRISIPPSVSGARQHRPIPLSVIMRLQNPDYAAAAARYAPSLVKDLQPGIYQQTPPLPREFLRPIQTPQPQQRQPAYYREVLHPGDVDAELEKLDSRMDGPMSLTDQGKKPEEEVKLEDPEMPPRPLSPSRLQPVVAPQAELVTNVEEVMQLRAEIPRALKRRGSLEVPQPMKEPTPQPNQYKLMINKLFRRKSSRIKEEMAAESGSSSDGDESPKSATSTHPIPITEIQVSSEQKVHSILRKSMNKANRASMRRAHLSPLVLMLDGALVGELETVQRAAQEVNDPSQSNDEGITPLHNAICGGHFSVVEFLVRIGANVSAPDSHGWTPLHCAASCNDRAMCEFLVRNGAAVMAVTDSDGATAAQKCDPYAPGFEECESFLRGVEEAMGVENSGVVYALWGYPAQAPDELGFKEGDMVTILQKPEGVEWWWASLCGREGFVPNNYFGLFPKVRPKSLC